MPQLMPLLWISSGVMIFLLFFVFLNLYFFVRFNVLGFDFNYLLNKNYVMKW